MIIENWSLFKENGNNEYCLVTDECSKFINGNLEKDGNLSSNIITPSVTNMSYDKAICNKNEIYYLGYINRDYHNYMKARYKQIGIISDWFLYYENNNLKIKAKISDMNSTKMIDDKVISYNSLNNELELESNKHCFITVNSINEYAKQFLITNNTFVNIENHKIANIDDYIVDMKSLVDIDQKLEGQKIKVLKK